MDDTSVMDSGVGTEGGKENEDELGRYLVVLGLFVFGGIVGGFAYTPDPTLGLMVGAFILGGGAWLIGTTDGHKFLENPKGGLGQTVQVDLEDGSAQTTRICKNCGWKNPNENNYCHDCGEQLGNADDEST